MIVVIFYTHPPIHIAPKSVERHDNVNLIKDDDTTLWLDKSTTTDRRLKKDISHYQVI